MSLIGNATPDATANYASRFESVQFNLLPKLGLTVSQVGFGGYRIDVQNKVHYSALTMAVQNGINLIDTSSNYADGRSELLVGKVLSDLCSEKLLQRDEVVIVSKVGYLQGQNYEMARQRRRQGRPFPNLVKYSTGLDHCIHPEFLHDQLARSLERLQVETIDVYLLHNPEYYLSWAKVANIPKEKAQLEYYTRIRLAFEYLEEQVENGRIQAYGVSSNTFPLSSKAYTFTSVEKLLEIAESISDNHHFQVIQMPMNLFETGASTEQNCEAKSSALTFAHAHELGVLINRPLNAFYNDQLVRLADVDPPSYPTSVEEVSTLVDSLVEEEAQFEQTWLSQFKTDTETTNQLLQYLALGQMLDGKWQGFGSFQNWKDLQDQFFIPRAQSAISFLSNHEKATAEFLDWLNRYIDRFNETLLAVAAFYQESGAKESKRIWQTAVSIDSAWEAETLSKTAVRALRSTEGVSCVLVGMRQERYVQEMVAEISQPVKQNPRVESWRALETEMRAS